ncbi:Transposase DDE domain-containing protein [Quadrisphaera granulorum]|uniref:DDE family transposase n=1 Tax=Quadrisphaera granulorum TaxID=317664 RepID=A0A316AUE8_9ACTN|nr:transposase [Quadrisphaera granulorum]PWJ53727.1 DDE family transposase [Quadrisphaera granulorum]SZE96771.1 Transposase DDE domain-containing protein [Quadrisphaera granulorum]
MFVRTSTRRNKDGTAVRYVQLAHNVYDPATKAGKTKVLHSFGREDDVDRAAIERLIDSLQRYLHSSGPGALLGTHDAGGGDGTARGHSRSDAAGLELLGSVALGATWALDGIWTQLGLPATLTRVLAGTRRTPAQVARLERILFALVAARAIDPASKLATAAWLGRRTWIPGLTDGPTAGTPDGADGAGLVSDDECYRAMDALIDHADEVEEAVFWGTATLLDLEVDLLFFDTTSTYFELDEADEPVLRDDRGLPLPDADDGPGLAGSATGDADEVDEAVATSTSTSTSTDAEPTSTADGQVDEQTDEQLDEPAGGRRAGFRTWGKSKDSRGDLPQIVIGMAVTRAGIPVRVWSWPGNTADSALIRQAKADMKAWTLSRIVWVGDRGFTSAANRADLRRGGHTYILGEKIRSGSTEAQTALSRPGRYQVVAENLQVKEVTGIREDERFIVCFNPDQAARDATIREHMVAKLEALIEGSDKLSVGKRGELAGKISTMAGVKRYLRRTPGGLLRIDKAKIAAEEKLDGKYLLRTCDPHLSAEEIALGYKQLIAVERGWRDLKTHLELRPVYHRREDRIRAHVLLCWLSLLAIRIIETKTGRAWAGVREDLQDLAAVTCAGPAGVFVQSTALRPATRAVLDELGVKPPSQILRLDTPTTAASSDAGHDNSNESDDEAATSA